MTVNSGFNGHLMLLVCVCVCINLWTTCRWFVHYFEPFGAIWNKFEPFWAILSHFEPVWPTWPQWPITAYNDPNWPKLTQTGPTTRHVCACVRACVSALTYTQVVSALLWAILIHSDPFWSILINSQPTWSHTCIKWPINPVLLDI